MAQLTQFQRLIFNAFYRFILETLDFVAFSVPTQSRIALAREPEDRYATTFASSDVWLGRGTTRLRNHSNPNLKRRRSGRGHLML